MKSKPKPKTPNSIAGFSEVIQRMGEQSRAAQNARVEQLRADLPQQIRAVGRKTDTELLDILMEQRGSHDPRETEVWAEYRLAVRKRILARLERVR